MFYSPGAHKADKNLPTKLPTSIGSHCYYVTNYILTTITALGKVKKSY